MSISLEHEAIVELLRRAPGLAQTFLGDSLEGEATLLDSQETLWSPRQLRSDTIVLIRSPNRPPYAIVVEVQLRRDRRKRRSWPLYLAALHARLGFAVHLVVLTLSRSVARWASRRIPLGHRGFELVPIVIGPDQLSAPLTEDQVRACPELALLSLLAQAQSPRAPALAQQLLLAVSDLDSARSELYADLVLSCLNASARAVLEQIMKRKQTFYTDFARNLVGIGIEQGIEQGIERGIEQGIEQGIVRGVNQSLESQRHITRKMLQLRYGDESVLDELLPQCKQADLKWLADRVLETPSAALLFVLLKARLQAA